MSILHFHPSPRTLILVLQLFDQFYSICCYSTKSKYFPILFSKTFIKTAISNDGFFTSQSYFSSFLTVVSRSKEKILERYFVVYNLGALGQFVPKLSKFTKHAQSFHLLNCLNIAHIYYLQKQLKHFGLKMSLVY